MQEDGSRGEKVIGVTKLHSGPGLRNRRPEHRHSRVAERDDAEGVMAAPCYEWTAGNPGRRQQAVSFGETVRGHRFEYRPTVLSDV